MATGASSFIYSGAFRADFGASSSSAVAVGGCYGGRRGGILNSPANCHSLRASSSFGRRRDGGLANFLSASSWGAGALIHHHQLRSCGAAAAGQGSDDERRSSTRRRVATSERSEACNEELLLFLFQLDLATRLQVSDFDCSSNFQGGVDQPEDLTYSDKEYVTGGQNSPNTPTLLNVAVSESLSPVISTITFQGVRLRMERNVQDRQPYCPKCLRALNSEQYEAAQQLREKIAEVDEEVARQREEKMGSVSSKDEAQDSALTVLRLKAELQTAIDGEDYVGAAQIRDRISKLESAALAASARALVYQNLKYTYRLGQRVKHKIYGYLGITCGMDPTCCESGAWVKGANVDQLPRGRNQPFYQVLVDVHEQPSLLVAYVAEDNLVPIEDGAKIERFDHPYTYFLFYGMDGKGDFIPSKQLREKYNAARHELPWDGDEDSPDSGGSP